MLTPYAVVDVLDMLGYLGFTALAVQEDRSFYERGKRVGSPLVSIADDSRDPAGLPVGFDAEGVPKQRLDLLAAGVCCDLPYDTQTAARAGRRSTGHGLPAPNPYGPFPTNMVMAAGDQSIEELIGGMDRGLLVTRFHYTNPVHQKKVIITGMTRDGTFLVEGGRIVGPVRNLRFTESYLDVLAGVEAVAPRPPLRQGLPRRERGAGRARVLVRVHGRHGGQLSAMGISDRTTADLTLYAESDGSISVDTGSRYVAVGGEDLERILDRLAADGGTLRLLGGTGRADDGDEPPDRESDPGMGAASHVLALAYARGLTVLRDEG